MSFPANFHDWFEQVALGLVDGIEQTLCVQKVAGI